MNALARWVAGVAAVWNVNGVAFAQDASTDAVPPVASSADDAAALAKKLSNPIASLISVPFQLNYDSKIGPVEGGDRITLNIQPVVPIAISDDWNMISRTIVPVIWQSDIALGSGTQFGIGDTVQSLFFVPAKPSSFTWGVGPVILLPTGTDRLLSGKKLGGGPTAVALKQMGGVTVGLLANHIWSVAGSNSRGDISSSFINPFISRTSKTAFTVAFAADATYDWKADKVVMPLTFSASQLIKLGKQPASFGVGFRYYAATSAGSPHGAAVRMSLTMLFPKK